MVIHFMNTRVGYQGKVARTSECKPNGSVRMSASLFHTTNDKAQVTCKSCLIRMAAKDANQDKF